MTTVDSNIKQNGAVSHDTHLSARILIVDDQKENVLLLVRILEQAGYKDVQHTTEPNQFLNLYEQFGPDLILLDLHMPHVDGIGLMKELATRIRPGDFLPILVLTADTTQTARDKALSLGAKDFLTKPFDPTEVLLRIENLIDTRFLHLQLQAQKGSLEEQVRLRTWDLQRAKLETLERLALAAEYRDDDTGEHTRRVGRMATAVAQTLGVSSKDVELINKAAPLHDVGKIGIPDSILLKPGRLTPEEFERITTHTSIGARILSGGGSRVLQLAEEIALSHHERWDGSGYPGGLADDGIPLSGRIVTVVDVFDALTHARPYKVAWHVEDALAEIESQSGRQFDPTVVSAFLSAHGSGALLGWGGHENDWLLEVGRR